MKLRVARYRQRMIDGPWQLQGCTAEGLDGVIVIPACGERESLPATLASLVDNPAIERQNWLTVVLINQPPQASQRLIDENLQTLAWLEQGGGPAGLQLAWIDAARPQRLLPARDAGVGLARKIGCDLALQRLRPGGLELLVWLDADTLVGTDYLRALRLHFANHPEGGATLPFAHQRAATSEAQRAIDRYELYLRHYVLGLQLAGSPYAYHSIGSSIACRASAYLAIGGMNRRRAGEDFYFLQQLAKTSGVRPLRGTLVRPSPRTSERVPFGTGEKIARLMAGEEAIQFYAPESFRLLHFWLELVTRRPEAEAHQLLDMIGAKSNIAADFLRAAGFATAWPKLTAQHRSPQALSRAFHGWFDALKSLRLIRQLNASQPSPAAVDCVARLLDWNGTLTARDPDLQLDCLRHLQNGAAPGRTAGK